MNGCRKNGSSKELSVEESARILGIAPQTLLNLVRHHQVRARRLRHSRQFVVSYDSLIEYFEANGDGVNRTAPARTVEAWG